MVDLDRSRHSNLPSTPVVCIDRSLTYDGFWRRLPTSRSVAQPTRRRSAVGRVGGGGQSNAGGRSTPSQRCGMSLHGVRLDPPATWRRSIRIYRGCRMAEGGLQGSPLHRLMRHPNNWQTAFEFKEMLQASLVLRATAMRLWCDGRGDRSTCASHPDRLDCLKRRARVLLCGHANGLHEMAMLREHPLLIHRRICSTALAADVQLAAGSSRLSLVRESLGLGSGWKSTRPGSSARRPHRWRAVTDQKFASKEIREQLREEWQRLQAGPRNSGATAILEQGLKWQASASRWSIVIHRVPQLPASRHRPGLRRAPYKLAIEARRKVRHGADGQQYLNGRSRVLRAVEGEGGAILRTRRDDTFLDWDYGIPQGGPAVAVHRYRQASWHG